MNIYVTQLNSTWQEKRREVAGCWLNKESEMDLEEVGEELYVAKVLCTKFSWI